MANRDKFIQGIKTLEVDKLLTYPKQIRMNSRTFSKITGITNHYTDANGLIGNYWTIKVYIDDSVKGYNFVF